MAAKVDPNSCYYWARTWFELAVREPETEKKKCCLKQVPILHYKLLNFKANSKLDLLSAPEVEQLPEFAQDYHFLRGRIFVEYAHLCDPTKKRGYYSLVHSY